jgi:hypothetical protein
MKSHNPAPPAQPRRSPWNPNRCDPQPMLRELGELADLLSFGVENARGCITWQAHRLAPDDQTEIALYLDLIANICESITANARRGWDDVARNRAAR